MLVFDDVEPLWALAPAAAARAAAASTVAEILRVNDGMVFPSRGDFWMHFSLWKKWFWCAFRSEI
jgi:hypothetical protein